MPPKTKLTSTPATNMDDVVRTLASHGIVRAYPKGAVIITEGDPSDSLYVILSGRVKVYLSDDQGREVVLDEHGPGNYVGEMSFDDLPRSASVMTLEPCTLAVVSGKEFRAFIASHPDATMHLIRNLIHRARVASANIRSLALLDVYGRVARLLLDLAVEKDGRLVVEQPYTQQELAQRVGCSREMVSRIFKDLVSGGYIQLDGRKIRIERALPSHW
jgi:CRP/FNR family transcriptional regulator, cyclic AMP receptor protein